MFADIHNKFKSSQALKAKKAEFNEKWSFKIIQGHAFWGQWKGDTGLNNTI